MKIKTHLKIISAIILFFISVSIIQNLFFPIHLNLKITDKVINDTLPRNLLEDNINNENLSDIITINNKTVSICTDFKEISQENIEKQIFLSLKVNCSCKNFFLERFVRYKNTAIYRLYSIDKPYSIKKENNATILIFNVPFDIARLDQKANILCFNSNSGSKNEK